MYKENKQFKTALITSFIFLLVGGRVAGLFFDEFFYEFAAQIAGKAGGLFYLKVVHLMFSRNVIARRVCFERRSEPETGGETQSELNYLLSVSAVLMARTSSITKCEGDNAPSKFKRSN